MVNSHRKVHFIGIGGIGMSALARYFLSEGWRVSGSDSSYSPITGKLEKEGVKIYIGKHSSNNLIPLIRAHKASNKVVYNQAISKNNPELVAAKKAGIPCRSYPQAIGELTKKYKTIAIAGAHGKSTTTVMTALILIEAGLDPTVIVGTKLKEFGDSNFRRGKSPYLVLEADEYGAAFLNYYPALSVVINLDKEHLDFYKNFSNIKKAFAQFRKQSKKVVVAEKSPKILAEIRKVLKIPGDHNVYNASCAYAISQALNIPHAVIIKALGKFRGSWRRMEFRGYLNAKPYTLSAKVYDDYAHHPTEIKATLTAFRQNWPKKPLICVFQPHQADRLKRLFSGFKTAFKAADKVIIIPAYKVAGRDEYFDKKYDAKALAGAIGAVYVKNPKKDLKRTLTLMVSGYTPDPIIVMMGAGNIVDYTDKLIK